MHRLPFLAGVIVALLACAPRAWSQPVDQPATAPSTAPVRYEMTAPASMTTLPVGDYTGVCPAAYSDGVQLGLKSIKPANRPTTMPSDLQANLTRLHDDLAKQMTADLALPDTTAATAYLDGPVTDGLKKLADIKPHMFILVATNPEVRDAIRAGWAAPANYHYNPLTDHVDYYDSATFPSDRAPDDVVLWVEIAPTMTPAQVSDLLVRRVEGFNQTLTNQMSTQGPQLALNLLIGFVRKQTVESLKLPASQEWFGMGIMGALAGKYAAELVGCSRSDMLAAAENDSPQNPIRAAGIDLLHPLDQAHIKPQFVPLYRDAMARKAIRVIDKLLTKAGDDAAGKVCAAVKTAPPADNAALVTLIQTTTGVDLSSDLQSQ